MSEGRSIKSFFRHLPLIGGLVDARWRDHREAINEVGVNILLSTMPIWLGCIFFLLAHNFSMSLGEAITHNVENGELFLYATSILAPLFYFIFKDYDGIRKFPNAASFMVLSVIVLLVGGCGFSFTRLGPLLGINYQWNSSTLFIFSAAVYAAAIVIVYLAHVYRNWRETGGAAAFTMETQDFVSAFNREPKS
ncbi:hypothetical protein [Acidisoma silvae]|uniref:Uncharacterized protein n=1 Tax=Acidisoma silvae TaxID=2802396 RepID=A0A963YWG7_9PROT|nr:hypothetical protein [Acidisoma silvae]MCB8878404.1 hypothetical protein [Acidisoma silvae]